MIGVLIVAHGSLAQALLDVSISILGKQEAVRAVHIDMADDVVDASRQKLLQAIDDVDCGHGVIVLTDLFGGTPSNLAISALGLKTAEIVTGVNLPMILKLLSIRHRDDLLTCVHKIVDDAQKHIRVASDCLKHPDFLGQSMV